MRRSRRSYRNNSPNDLTTLTERVSTLLNDPQRMANLASSNLEKSKDYHRDILTQRAWDFCEQLRAKCRNTP